MNKYENVIVNVMINMHFLLPITFLKAFTVPMWCVTGAFFIFVGPIVWILEHRVNPQFRGSPGEQLVTICWSVSSTKNFHYQYNMLVSRINLTTNQYH